MLAEDRASTRCGIRLLRNAPGSATVTMTVTAEMTNGHDITHGGYVFLLADTAFAVAVNGYGRTTVSSGATITYIAPTTVGDELVAEAVERIRYGRSGVYDVTVRRGETVIAEFRGNSRELGPR
ncbi:hydroxyphenylacetyl-CoA thioesterase PaaI [Nocardia panacis]|uniref:Hydroxyphenylacetyl-CoA thioesterase PaaI n=1 Tax=Nocardia panacis TaxID=2340916 RepID=A0A3A4K210_9NOCA|nr:hydroxyphenylacetyl-CoA thioesterase PaaI [Nocardia panacis]RJO73820.1 hydroxyphenylacetyl-CoA thioesterase PaaI [Nocardia panacis]